MKTENKKFEIKIRNEGHPSQYYTLTIFNEDGTKKEVHTSQSYSYIFNLSYGR